MTVTQSKEPLQTLSEIRSLMERSSRFISLSGLSGVFAGMVALAGAALVYIYLETTPFHTADGAYFLSDTRWGMTYFQFFGVVAAAVFVIALLGAIYFTTRRARRQGLPIWDRMTRRLLVNLTIPLAAGAVFIFALLHYELYVLIAPVTLIFYGLGLVNAGKYTHNDIRYLGILEIVLGSVALFYIGYGLEFWAVGFGILHILYGIIMYRKYEKHH